MRIFAVALALLSPLLMAQAKPVLVPDVSQRDIQIAYSFTGAELLLFGAITRSSSSHWVRASACCRACSGWVVVS